MKLDADINIRRFEASPTTLTDIKIGQLGKFKLVVKHYYKDAV